MIIAFPRNLSVRACRVQAIAWSVFPSRFCLLRNTPHFRITTSSPMNPRISAMYASVVSCTSQHCCGLSFILSCGQGFIMISSVIVERLRSSSFHLLPSLSVNVRSPIVESASRRSTIFSFSGCCMYVWWSDICSDVVPDIASPPLTRHSPAFAASCSREVAQSPSPGLMHAFYPGYRTVPFIWSPLVRRELVVSRLVSFLWTTAHFSPTCFFRMLLQPSPPHCVGSWISSPGYPGIILKILR